LKRNIYTNSFLSVISGRIRNRFSKEQRSFSEVLQNPSRNRIRKNHYLRIIFISSFFLVSPLASIAPDTNHLNLELPSPINPFEPLMYAIGMVETMCNTRAYNEFENAVGIFQIRQVKVDEYNRQTNGNYNLSDMFDYEISRKVFLHFASKVGPYNFEKIAKAWNGSGPMTEFYWARIRSHLKELNPS
jgi:hypothetical protein